MKFECDTLTHLGGASDGKLRLVFRACITFDFKRTIRNVYGIHITPYQPSIVRRKRFFVNIKCACVNENLHTTKKRTDTTSILRIRFVVRTGGRSTTMTKVRVLRPRLPDKTRAYEIPPSPRPPL